MPDPTRDPALTPHAHTTSSAQVPHATEASASGAPYVLTAQEYDAVLLAGFGGPEGQEDVLPFLRNVTRGRGIPDERLEEVATHYRHFGGVSPINEHNRQLREAIEAEMRSRGMELPIYWGNRNWAPYLEDVVQEAAAAGHTRLLAVATSAYSSYSSCRQYREDFARAVLDTGLAGVVRIDKVRQFFDVPGFVQPFAEGVAEALRGFAGQGFAAEEIRVLFATHSIPTADAERSGPQELGLGEGGAYAAQHLAVGEQIMGRLRAEDVAGDGTGWELVYQSRSGPPSQPWLEPDVCDRIAELPGEGVKAVAVVPLGFLSDHMEVLWDLDEEAMEAAEEAGLRAVRTPTPGVHQAFVSSLVDLVQERMEAVPVSERPHLTELGPWYDVCRPGCCENVRRGFSPVAAGVVP
ncbi:ferrochelatase [Nesterenkonia xinjiangensis]|uniref:Coproporphyrin III ferrochelatase n=1 Tax=Nesterenkonia xinjiangensis TaxID=225327 RepID=A0A7Z0K8F7_9MICC|nr:ferrochelatase [Nesterenkonia xinjiangensis]NYJ77584.1 ferrochelatase [Nesterenkonia xinjiangensis]